MSLTVSGNKTYPTNLNAFRMYPLLSRQRSVDVCGVPRMQMHTRLCWRTTLLTFLLQLMNSIIILTLYNNSMKAPQLAPKMRRHILQPKQFSPAVEQFPTLKQRCHHMRRHMFIWLVSLSTHNLNNGVIYGVEPHLNYQTVATLTLLLTPIYSGTANCARMLFSCNILLYIHNVKQKSHLGADQHRPQLLLFFRWAAQPEQ